MRVTSLSRSFGRALIHFGWNFLLALNRFDSSGQKVALMHLKTAHVVVQTPSRRWRYLKKCPITDWGKVDEPTCTSAAPSANFLQQMLTS